MNKLTRGLMSGASLAALSLGSISVAEAGNITISASSGAVQVTAAQVYSFIEVTGTGTVNGDITNDGVVGVGNAFGIEVLNGGKVLATTVAAGSIVNNNLVIATRTGIFVGSAAEVDGNIVNNGTLVVSNNAAAGIAVVGILDNGGLVGGVTNNSEIIVAGMGTAGASFIGVEQNGTHADFTNNGLLKVTGGGAANYVGVSQHASGATAIEASIVNSATGSIKVDVATVDAFGSIATGIDQHANATAGAASVNIDNSGLIEISSVATSPIVPVGVAQATAFIDGGIRQNVHGVGGTTSSVIEASAALTNESTGTINIVAAANVFGLTSARAFAEVDTGISQFAHVTQLGVPAEGDASVALTNDGVITVAARAHATGAAFARAFASISGSGVFQWADLGDNSTVTLTNSLGATLNVDATAGASALLHADATAEISQGIGQFATAGGDKDSGNVTLTNDGTLNILASASANAGTDAFALAFIRTAVSQVAFASSMNVVLNNTGTLNVVAQAIAAGTDFASAVATVEFGLFQEADSTGVAGSTATDALTNSGTINIHAVASAHGGTDASAFAENAFAISQEAFNAVTENLSLTNSGTIDILAHAVAAASSVGVATATVTSAIRQSADGDALVGSNNTLTLTNSGTINIHAIATAGGVSSAFAFATVDVGIDQSAYDAFSETVALTNSGTLDILAHALANASGFASASADVDQGIIQSADGDALVAGTTNVSLTNSGTINIHALATANGSSAFAFAFINTGITQDAFDAVTNTVTLTNSGTIDILAQAIAHATGFAFASATVDTGMEQFASGSSLALSSASVSLTNSGTINIHALATATGDGANVLGVGAKAFASVSEGVRQFAEGADASTVTLTNSGLLSIEAQAFASATTAKAIATAKIRSNGIEQEAFALSALGNSAAVSLTNSGTIDVGARATAVGATAATANALLPHNGVNQEAGDADVASVSLTNSGTINIDAVALADPTGRALANAFIATSSDSAGIRQDAFAENLDVSATASLTNSGNINIEASATASGGTSGDANARVHHGITQVADHANAASVTLTNSGTIDIGANAFASGSSAFAHATVTRGIEQFATGDSSLLSTATASLTNSGTINIHAKATAIGGTFASAIVSVSTGVRQEALDAVVKTESFTNSGTFNVSAHASASAVTDAFASAFAWGVFQDATSGVAESFTNSGTFKVTAFAAATAFTTASAQADATGLVVYADPGTVSILNTASGVFDVSAKAVGTTGSATAIGIYVRDPLAGDTLAGTIENDGQMNVTAQAPGDAFAQGISVHADEFTGTITNKGNLHVAAIGAFPTATGIAISSFSTPTGLGVGTIVNDGGTLWAGVSTDGGLTFTRGDAIFVRNAPNTININLKGTAQDGNIYGNIDLAAGDTVTVSSGRTKFDGIVNDNSALVGTLAIAADGTLEFRNGPGADRAVFGVGQSNVAEGPAHAFVDTFTQSGTLELEVTAGPATPLGPALINTAGFVSATNATLGGSVVVALHPGLYGNSTIYQTIFSGTPIAGDWTSLSTASNSVLFTVSENRPTAFEADIVLNRVAFDAVACLTPNEEEVGDGLEGGYKTSGLTPGSTALYE